METINYTENTDAMMAHANKEYGPDYHCRFLFLDFDGVINVPYHDERDLDEDWVFKANCYTMEYLNKLCKEFSLEIICSSSWRSLGLEWVKEYLNKSGLDEDIPVVGTTGYDDLFRRYHEIYEYLEDHPFFTEILILDDSPMGPLDKYQVRTDFMTGFKEEAYEQARILLTKQIEGK